MSIDAISGIGTSSMLGAFGVGSTSTTSAVAGTSGVQALGSSFGASLTSSVDQLQAVQSNAKALAVEAVTGDLDDIHDYTIAAAEASTTLELTAALRNKAVEAFSEIMRMQA
ncbi:flagellar hook-basal body complex protein FliE [Actinotalea sp.]|uniref:flagellar hook-basal body complex protein FliE n=1 Tax=Actinotalea sp. TaxID=1872145 RepID=UPI003563F74C